MGTEGELKPIPLRPPNLLRLLYAGSIWRWRICRLWDHRADQVQVNECPTDTKELASLFSIFMVPAFLSAPPLLVSPCVHVAQSEIAACLHFRLWVSQRHSTSLPDY